MHPEQQVGDWLRAAGRVTVLSGAGISTESGIPDFRGPQGVWTRNPAAQTMFTFDNYVADADVRRQAWRNRLEHPAWDATPNAGHRALVDLERSGRLRAIITQNIDGLHQRAGNDPAKVIEIHGTLFEVECLGCERRTSMRENLDRVEAGEPDPACLVCGGIQKAATISFGQSLRSEDLWAAQRAAEECDLMLAVGTTLQVQPAAGLAGVATDAGARLVIVNRDPTPYDGLASALLRDPIGQTLPRLVAPLAA
ncbi:MAG: NAD-dependent deacetylase [Actinomycetota bacterium]|nr:NAD-dependent deacetylase [Actinomycetota bacterium]MDQ1671001.1 NAD-dependent deacetylase [Actinomycetota bacterium]